MRLSIVTLPLLFVFAGLTACGAGEGLQVTALQLGRAVNTDGTIAGHTTRFAPDDSVHLSIVTSGVGSATLGVRWKYRGRLVDEPTKKVSYQDVAATPFSLRSAGGFPVGDYSVEALLDGKPVGSREFRVEARP